MVRFCRACRSKGITKSSLDKKSLNFSPSWNSLIKGICNQKKFPLPLRVFIYTGKNVIDFLFWFPNLKAQIIKFFYNLTIIISRGLLYQNEITNQKNLRATVFYLNSKWKRKFFWLPPPYPTLFSPFHNLWEQSSPTSGGKKFSPFSGENKKFCLFVF